MSDLNGKLIRVEWTINVYDKNDELIKEVDIDVPPMERLRQIIPPNDDDPDLVDGYKLNVAQLQELNLYLKEPIYPQFNLYSYYLVSGGIYDWNKD